MTGIIVISLASLLWGTTGSAASFADNVSPLAIGSAALGIGGLLQTLIAIPAIRTAMPDLQVYARIIAVGALAVALYPLAFYTSMHLAGVAIGTVVTLGSAPLASGVLEKVVDGLTLSRWWILAAIIGATGSVLLCFSRLDSEGGELWPTLVGILLGLIGGAGYALYSWAAHALMQRGIPRAAAMGSVFGGGGMMLMPVLALTGAPLLATATNFRVAAYLALIPMFLGYVLFGMGLARVSASMATTLTLSEPAVAAILAVVIVGERLSFVGWIGLAMIAAVMVMLAIMPPATSQRGSQRISSTLLVSEDSLA